MLSLVPAPRRAATRFGLREHCEPTPLSAREPKLLEPVGADLEEVWVENRTSPKASSENTECRSVGVGTQQSDTSSSVCENRPARGFTGIPKLRLTSGTRHLRVGRPQTQHHRDRDRDSNSNSNSNRDRDSESSTTAPTPAGTMTMERVRRRRGGGGDAVVGDDDDGEMVDGEAAGTMTTESETGSGKSHNLCWEVVVRRCLTSEFTRLRSAGPLFKLSE